KFVFSRFIREVGDGFAIRRPSRVAIGHGWAMREVADIPLVCGNSKDFSPGFEDGAHSAGGNAEILYTLGVDLREMRADGGYISSDTYVDVPCLMCIELKKFDGAKLFDDDRVRSGGCILETEVIT